MAASFYFYDLETSGFNPREARIMQFGGQRTDTDLRPVGEPDNWLIRMSEDILPDPAAVLLTGITPQQTLESGVGEAEFLKIFSERIATEGTIFVGYNTVRFDDEFMRFLHYRNFYDPYEWQWQGGRSKWDLLDVVRMTRALRPEGIKWPVDGDGKSINRLELLAKLNNLDHANAHDALSDVNATIALAQLIKNKQPKLFAFLLGMRDKKKLANLVLGDDDPLVYTCGKYPAEFEKTTVVVTLAEHPQRNGALVYDLRHDPTEFAALSAAELAERWAYSKDENAPPRLPVKTLQFNHCPAVAPLSVLNAASQKRLKINLKVIETNRQQLKNISSEFTPKVLEALKIIDTERTKKFQAEAKFVDAQLYDGFFDDQDRQTQRRIQAAQPAELSAIAEALRDERLQQLLPLYKARNFPASLTDEERAAWDNYRQQKLLAGQTRSRLAQYGASLQAAAAEPLNADQEFLLQELQLWGERIMPIADAENPDSAQTNQ